MLVENAYQVKNNSIEWPINVKRNLNDWEILEYEGILKILASQHISSQPDQIWWCLVKHGNFSVRSYYQLLFNVVLRGSSISPGIKYGKQRFLHVLLSSLGKLDGEKFSLWIN